MNFSGQVKRGFSWFYNKRHKRKGFFWSGRFKSVIVDNGDTLINCLAYIDLNPVRAGIVEKPENYCWSSIGYHIQTNNKNGFLSLDFGPSGIGGAFHGAGLAEFCPGEIRDAVPGQFHPDGIKKSKTFHRTGKSGPNETRKSVSGEFYEINPSEMGEPVTSEFHRVNKKDINERLKYYRKFLYEKGGIECLEKEAI